MMFAGMIRVENNSKTPQTDTDSTCHRCAVRTGGVSPKVAAGSYRRRSFRRPGYMRSEPLNHSCDSKHVSGSPTTENTQKSASKLPSSPSERWLREVFKRDDGQDSPETHRLRDAKENSPVPSRSVFNSSFSFIQQSLETGDLVDVSANKSASKRSERSAALEPHTALVVDPLSQSEISTSPISQSERELFSLSNSPCSTGRQKSLLLDRELWLADLDVQISSSVTSYAKESVQDSDSGSLDTEVTSSFSIDSSDSASSVTSGYDSTTPSSDQSRDGLRKKYEDVLQDCLQSNRTNTKIESMMMKLQRLQHKAVLDDDYDTAEHFGEKLEELRRERATLKPGLPSRHPQVTGFLERLRAAVHSVIHRTDTDCRFEHIQQLHKAALFGLKIQLQEQERALRSSIKEATAKVVMSQRLGSSVSRKVSESDTQLLTLHEAKLAALSGNDFCSAKELKAEIRSAYGERDRLEGLERKLKTLSTGSGRDLSRMKEQHKQIKLELQEREAQYERSLKENTLKYIELLEDRLHSCGSPALEHIWEADLEACHLLLKGLDQRTSSISESEDLPSIPGSGSDVLPFTKEEADCAMLTALGGRWCPEADLQHSEFTKKLEEFLFCLEDASPEDLCGETTELAERCELISERLHYLEEQLQTAIEQHDKDLTHILTELLKAALQAMLSQLKEDEEEDEEEYCDVEEEEHYFSDSWEI
uniref:DISC1 scaffold protein n=1 Tax=Cyprinus carpio TaxID=7962 RepID=A0A8C2BWU9_CYPCA